MWPPSSQKKSPEKGLIDELGFRNKRAGWTMFFAVATLALAIVVGFAALDNILRISLLVVVVVFWIALWLVIFISKDPSAKEIGVALLSGLIVAGAAFALNTVLTSALLDRDTARRQAETRLTMNRREQFSFRTQDMSGFDLSGMALNRTGTDVFDLSFTDLSGANLSNAELRGAQLRETSLRDADLTSADLTRANLRSADLTDAILSGANLSGADLTGAVGFVEPEDGDLIVLSEETRCPGEQDGSGSDGPLAAPDAQGRFTCVGEDQVQKPAAAEQPYVAFLVSKDDAFGTIVGQVTTDHPDRGMIEYDIADVGSCRQYPADFAGHFAIDRRTGVVTIARTLDDELLLAAEDRSPPQFCVRLQGATEGHITVHIELDDETTEIEPALAFLVPAGTEDGARIGRVRAPESWRPSSYAIEGESSDQFQIDEETGVLSLNSMLEADSPPRLLTVRIKSRRDEKKSTSVLVRVAVETEEVHSVTAALSEALPHHYLVEDGGVLDVEAGRGLLTLEQIEAGLSLEVVAGPTAGSLDGVESNGAFTYRHGGQSQADTFTYRTLEQPEATATATIAAVSTTEFEELNSTSEAGVEVASLAVVGAPEDSIQFTPAAESGQLFSVDSDGSVVTRVGGQEIFEEGPWHDGEIRVTDLRSAHSVTVPISVSVRVVVEATTTLAQLSTQFCPRATNGEYVKKIENANRLESPLDIDPGDALELPRC